MSRLSSTTKFDNLYFRRGNCRGLSYVEVLFSAVILAILMVSALRLYANLGTSRYYTLRQDFAQALALEMIEEIKQLPYQDPANDGEFGPGTDEINSNRSKFDDIDDYLNWSACPPQQRDGTTMTQFADITRAVAVRYVRADDFTQSAPSDEGFIEITITISDDHRILAQHKYVIARVPYQL